VTVVQPFRTVCRRAIKAIAAGSAVTIDRDRETPVKLFGVLPSIVGYIQLHPKSKSSAPEHFWSPGPLDYFG